MPEVLDQVQESRPRRFHRYLQSKDSCALDVGLLKYLATAHEKVRPTSPWIDTTRRDKQDGKVDVVGYEISFNRYFSEYRRMEEIETDMRAVEKEIRRHAAGSGGWATDAVT
jgi:hypothetical protein